MGTGIPETVLQAIDVIHYASIKLYVLFIWPQDTAVGIRSIYKKSSFLYYAFCNHIQSIKDIAKFAEERKHTVKTYEPDSV